jgi:hypothetical protein
MTDPMTHSETYVIGQIQHRDVGPVSVPVGLLPRHETLPSRISKLAREQCLECKEALRALGKDPHSQKPVTVGSGTIWRAHASAAAPDHGADSESDC